MILRKRKGMALITVVLIAALFLVSIVGISAKVITEKKVSNARASSERALVAAETGLSQTLFNLRNADFMAGTTAPSTDLEYLKIDDVTNIASGPSPFPELVVNKTTEPPPPFGTNIPYVIYQVKIVKTGGDVWTPSDDPSDETKNVSLKIYSLGTVYNDPSKAEVLARRVVRTTCTVDFNKAVNTIDFGILSGGDIKLNLQMAI